MKLQETLREILELKEGASEEDICASVRKLHGRMETFAERAAQWEARFDALAQDLDKEVVDKAFNIVLTDRRRDVLAWLDPESRNFLGTGMTMQEFWAHQSFGRFGNSFTNRRNDERNRRIDLIVRMAARYYDIQNQDIHATAQCRSAIEEVIDGKFDMLEQSMEWVGIFSENEFASYKDRSSPEEWDKLVKEQQERQALWAPFRKLCFEAFGPQRPPAETKSESLEQMLTDGDWVQLENGNWMRTDDSDYFKSWPRGTRDGKIPCCLPHTTAIELYALGVRWHADDGDEPGYWHLASGEKFPENPEKWYGEIVYRKYSTRELLGWLDRQRSDG